MIRSESNLLVCRPPEGIIVIKVFDFFMFFCSPGFFDCWFIDNWCLENSTMVEKSDSIFFLWWQFEGKIISWKFLNVKYSIKMIWIILRCWQKYSSIQVLSTALERRTWTKDRRRRCIVQLVSRGLILRCSGSELTRTWQATTGTIYDGRNETSHSTPITWTIHKRTSVLWCWQMKWRNAIWFWTLHVRKYWLYLLEISFQRHCSFSNMWPILTKPVLSWKISILCYVYCWKGPVSWFWMIPKVFI